jgi:deoxycytidylate deaminase
VGGEAILYCDTCPCLTCSIKIVQVGIKEVVYSQGYSMDAETEKVFAKAGVRLRQFIPVCSILLALTHLLKPETNESARSLSIAGERVDSFGENGLALRYSSAESARPD